MPITWSKDVYSSNLQTVEYDQETKEMFVTFLKGGARYVYDGVPEELANSLALAASPGSMLRTEVQPYYAYRRV